MKVHVRLAEHDGAIYLDLADQERNIVCISREGWRVTQDAPVRFRRPRGMLALPIPVRGGSLAELRGFINIGDDRQFVLLCAWLVAALRPGRSCPILAFGSEQGSGKSTLTRILRMLVDPNTAPIRCEPRDVRDLMIAASHSLVLALDNLSSVSVPLSDALCRLSTGGGYSTRMLYENDEEMIFDVLRPVILNGIEELGTRSDLLERTIRLSLPSIPEERRQPEDELFEQFASVRPRLLGALLTAVSTALAHVDSVRLDRHPRMADFAKWTVAAESALPWEPGGFMKAYDENRAGAHELALEDSPIGEPMQQFALAHKDWRGKISELHRHIEASVEDQVRSRQGWPKRANTFSGMLRRLVPNLRAIGVYVEFHDHSREGRFVTVATTPPKIVTTVTNRHIVTPDAASRGACDDPLRPGDDAVTMCDGVAMPAVTQSDDGDDLLHPYFGTDDELEERMAIMEFEGGLPREQAETRALRHHRNGQLQRSAS